MHLCISSKDRDPLVYPNPSEYVIRLDPPLKGIERMALIHVAFANTQYTLLTPYPVVIPSLGINTTIPPGMYSSTDIANAIQAILPNLDAWHVRVDRTTRHVVVSSVTEFSLNGISSNLLGDGWYHVVLTDVMGTDDGPLVMDIRLHGNMKEVGYHSFDTFASIPMTSTTGTYSFLGPEHPVINVQNPPILLDRLHISFRRSGGRSITPILDHEMVFSIE